MQMDDMILVSIDDHMVEPPDMFENHVPDKYRDLVPKVVRNDNGVDEWHFQGQATSTPFGMAATVGWNRDEWGFNPGSYSELRPGCFDVHERVRDMDANGVLGSMNFPTSRSRRSTGWASRGAGRSASSRPRTSRGSRASSRGTGIRCSPRCATRAWCCRSTSGPD